jgi:flagellar motor switch protein FliN/FliY
VSEENPTPEGVSAEAAAGAAAGALGGLDLISDVELRLTVEIGASRLLLRDVLQLGKGSVVELDRDTGEPADILVNGRLIARGDVSTVDDRMVIRIVEVLSEAAR